VKWESSLARARARLKLLLPVLAGFAVFLATAAETPVTISELPPKARQAIETHVGTAKLGKITRSVDGCDVTYDVEITRDGRDRGLTVNDAGELLETEVFMRELPRPVARAIRERIGRGAPDSIFKNHADGEVSYDVAFTKEGKERDFTVDEKGELLDEEVFQDELPPQVNSAIQKHVAGLKPGDIYKTRDEGKVYYEVEFERNGKTRTVAFDEKGVVAYEDEPVSFSDLPQAARDAAKASLGDATPCSVNKHIEGDDVSCEIEFKKDGKTESITVAADGKAD